VATYVKNKLWLGMDAAAATARVPAAGDEGAA
jgi:hypothetical protein